MSIITQAIGALMAAFGAFMFARSKARHITGLFPAAIGLLLVGLGFAGKNGSSQATVAAAGVATAGLLVPVQGLVYPDLFPATAADGQPHPDRRLAQAGTALLSGVYLVLVAGFTVARRLRHAG